MLTLGCANLLENLAGQGSLNRLDPGHDRLVPHGTNGRIGHNSVVSEYTSHQAFPPGGIGFVQRAEKQNCGVLASVLASFLDLRCGRRLTQAKG